MEHSCSRLFNVKVLIIFSGLVASSVLGQTVTFYQTGQEFIGPFSSWKNVKTDFGAVGNGTTDDAPAIQRALDQLKNVSTNTWCVLYFPAGTYKISTTLNMLRAGVHQNFLGASLIGEDPQNTVISWAGPANGTMLHTEFWYGTIGRLTFDGKTTAGTGIFSGDEFSDFSELTDLVFKDMKEGMTLGAAQGEAHWQILRNRFYRCSNMGINCTNPNTLNIDVFFSYFEDCKYGLYNNSGNYHVYNSVFVRSTTADMGSKWPGEMAIVGNISINSKRCIDWYGSDYGSPTMVRGNTVYGYTDTYYAMQFPGNWGGLTYVDNVIRTDRDNDSRSQITFGINNVLSVNNTYTSKQLPKGITGKRFKDIGSIIVDKSTITVPATVSLPGTPQNLHRKIFEVQQNTGNDGTEIQAKIISASSELYGTRPVVHIPKGKYSIRSTIVVPRMRDVQIVGDNGFENGSSLAWGGTVTGTPTIFRFMGPSRATLKEVSATGAIIVDSCDQPGGRIFMDQLNSRGEGQTALGQYGVFVNGVEESDVSIYGCNFYNFSTAYMVKGGANQAAGTQTNGQVSMITGEILSEKFLFDVTNNGKVVSEAWWMEGSTIIGPTHINLTSASSGNITISASRMAHDGDASLANNEINGFSGRFTLLNFAMLYSTPLSAWTRIQGDGSQTKAFIYGGYIWANAPKPTLNNLFRDQSTPAAQAAFMGNSVNGGVNDSITNVYMKQSATIPPDQFILDQLKDIRELRIEPPMDKAAGVTDLKIYRVSVSAKKDGISFQLNSTRKVGDPIGVIRGQLPIKKGISTRSHQTIGLGEKIIVPTNAKSISLFDIQGKMLWNQELTGIKSRLDAVCRLDKAKSKGVYVVRIINHR